jgi:transposase
MTMPKLFAPALRELRTDVRHLSCNSPAQHELHRLHCVYLVALGHSCREVAEWFGDGARSVQRWVTTYAHECDRGSKLERAPLARPNGRPPRISAVSAQRLQLDLHGLPRACGYPNDHWDGPLVQQHLRAHYGVDLSLRQCQRFLHDSLSRVGAIRGAGGPPAGPRH